MFNGLSQNPTFNEKPWFLYRVKNIKRFMKIFDIRFKEIETLMTHDAHMLFENIKQMNDSIKK